MAGVENRDMVDHIQKDSQSSHQISLYTASVGAADSTGTQIMVDALKVWHDNVAVQAAVVGQRPWDLTGNADSAGTPHGDNTHYPGTYDQITRNAPYLPFAYSLNPD